MILKNQQVVQEELIIVFKLVLKVARVNSITLVNSRCTRMKYKAVCDFCRFAIGHLAVCLLGKLESFHKNLWKQYAPLFIRSQSYK